YELSHPVLWPTPPPRPPLFPYTTLFRSRCHLALPRLARSRELRRRRRRLLHWQSGLRIHPWRRLASWPMLTPMGSASPVDHLWFLFAHGAGAPSSSAWMKRYATLLEESG